MDTDCRHCHASNSLLVNHSEGNIVCSECGVVSEHNMWMEERFEPDGRCYGSRWRILYDFVPYATFSDSVLLLACDIYTNKMRTRVFRGRNKRAALANCLMLACKECNVPITSKEMACVCGIEPSRLVKLEVMADCDTDYADMVSKYTSQLDLPRPTRMEYNKRLRTWLHDDTILEGKSPHTRIVTFIYCLGMRYGHTETSSKKFLVDTFDISIVTLNKALKEFLMNHSNL